MFNLELYQQKAKANIAASFAVFKRVLLQSATGSGKTVIAVDFIKDWMEENPDKTVLCLFNLQCLLPQFEETFSRHGMRNEVSVLHDVISRAKDGSRMVDHKEGCTRRILLTMPETYAGVMEGRGSMDLELCPTFEEKVGLILIDEAHKGTSENFQKIRDAYPNAQVLGLTATPMRTRNKDGECLANDWEYELVTTVSIRELIDMGRLVSPLYYDLDEDGHLYNEWKRAVDIHSVDDGNKQTIWFVRDTAHAKDWETKLLEIGETVRVVTSVDDEVLGTTSQTPNQREVIYKEFANQEITHLISVQALCEGFDSPIAKYCIIDRGIGNKALYQQILGRVLRPYKGKVRGHIIDRCGNHRKHGDIEDYQWSLDAEEPGPPLYLDGTNVVNIEKAARVSKIMVKCKTHGCPSVFNATRLPACPHCNTGHNLQVAAPTVAWMAHLFPQVKPTIYSNLIATVHKAIRGDEIAMRRAIQVIEDLVDEDGALNPKYAAITVMNPKNLKVLVQIPMAALSD